MMDSYKKRTILYITISKDACEIWNPIKGVIIVVKISSNILFPLKSENTQSSWMARGKYPSWVSRYRYTHLNFMRSVWGGVCERFCEESVWEGFKYIIEKDNDILTIFFNPFLIYHSNHF